VKYAAALVMAIGIAAATAAACEVKIAETAVTDHNVITLCDVAAITKASAAERERLSSVAVGLMGEGVESVTIDADAVRAALLNASVNLAKVTVSGASASHVTKTAPSGAQTPWAPLAVETYLKGVDPESSYKVSDVRLDWTPAAGLAPVIVAANAKKISGLVRFDAADASNLSKVLGHVYATVTKSVRMVVTRGRIPAGRMIAPDDVEVKYAGEDEAAGCAESVESTVGRRLLYTLEPGSPVLGKYLKNEDTIKRGDQVVLTYASEGLTVTVKTVALQDAGDGDRLRLRRAGGSEEHIGVVVGAGRAVPVTGEQK
jgi:flagella basal body P-ring formation protein FlgA